MDNQKYFTDTIFCESGLRVSWTHLIVIVISCIGSWIRCLVLSRVYRNWNITDVWTIPRPLIDYLWGYVFDCDVIK